MAEQKAKRYKIANHRPGESFQTPIGIVYTNEIDGGARLSPGQKKFFEDTGETLIEVDVLEPAPSQPAVNADAEKRMAENSAIAASQADQESRVAAAIETNVAATAASGLGATIANDQGAADAAALKLANAGSSAGAPAPVPDPEK